jgi:hypothetical protein
LQRIDYIWHSAGLVAITTELGQAGGSDHLPVIVRFNAETQRGGREERLGLKRSSDLS